MASGGEPASSLKVDSSVFHRSLSHEPVIVERAKGNYLYLKDGRRVLDGCGGAAVVSVGHAHPQILAGVADQMSRVSYVHSGAFASETAEELARRLTASAGMARAVFYSGGTEALDCSLKLARQYHIENHEPARVKFIGRDRSYHGNSLSTLALGRHRQRRAPYEPLFAKDNFHHVSPAYAYRYKREDQGEQDYVRQLAQELEDKILALGPQTVAAFYAETIVGATTGCVPAPAGYFKAIKKVCDKYGVLLVLDEIMCGMGRSGKMHAWQWEGAQPDLQIVGKALGGGYAPISAVLLSQTVVDAFSRGSGAFNNGHTFQSHVIGCRVALEIMKLFEAENLVEQCNERGKQLEQALRARLANHPNVGDIRGRGLFWGIELVGDRESRSCLPLDFPVADTVERECLQRGVAVYPGGKGTYDGHQGDHILVAPPYTITVEEIDMIVTALDGAINATMQAIAVQH